MKTLVGVGLGVFVLSAAAFIALSSRGLVGEPGATEVSPTDAPASGASIAAGSSPVSEAAGAAPGSVESAANPPAIDVTQFEPTSPRYMIREVYPLCGMYDNLFTYDRQGKPTRTLIPFCHHLKGGLDHSTARYFEIVSIDSAWVEVRPVPPPRESRLSQTAAERGADPRSAVDASAIVYVKLEELATPLMLERDGRRWPLPFIHTEATGGLIRGSLEWCELEFAASPSFVLPERGQITPFADIESDRDCRT